MIGVTDLAARAAELGRRVRTRVDTPWDLYVERLERHEVYLNGSKVEMVRGPIHLEGAGLRIFRPVADGIGLGFFATSGLSGNDIDAAIDTAQSAALLSRTPAKSIPLPARGGGSAPKADTVDRRLWDTPRETLAEYARLLAESFDDTPKAELSFATLQATIGESTLVNSAGFESGYRHTMMYREIAAKAAGGPEGRAPGEYWTTAHSRQLMSDDVRPSVESWTQRAQDARDAKETPGGSTKVVMPPAVLATFLPAVLGFRMSGMAELRHMAPKSGDQVASEHFSLEDDGLLPFGIGTAPIDDEGFPHRRQTLVRRGAVATTLQDVVSAGALGTPATGSGQRYNLVNPEQVPWFRFTHAPSAQVTTLVVESGYGGTDAELVEAAGEGIWVEQIGFTSPEPLSGAFGGEIRLGYRIRNGRLAEPIRGGTVGGVVISGPEQGSFLKSIIAVGSRPTLVEHLYSAPILIGDMAVAGT